MQTKLSEAQKLLNSLTAQEKARLAALAAKQEAEAKAKAAALAAKEKRRGRSGGEEGRHAAAHLRLHLVEGRDQGHRLRARTSSASRTCGARPDRPRTTARG